MGPGSKNKVRMAGKDGAGRRVGTGKYGEVRKAAKRYSWVACTGARSLIAAFGRWSVQLVRLDVV